MEISITPAHVIEVDVLIDKQLQVIVDGVVNIDVDVQFQGIQGPQGPEGKVLYLTTDW